MTLQYEPSAISQNCATDNAYKKSHSELKNTIDPLVTDPAADSKADYAKIATGWEEAVNTFSARLKRSSAAAWTGNAATKAQEAITKYTSEALDLTPALKELSTRVDEAITAVQNTKKNLTGYSDDDQDWWNPGDWFDGDPAAKAEESAQKIFQEQYIKPLTESDKLIPILPTPQDPTDPDKSLDNGGQPPSGTPYNGGNTPSPSTIPSNTDTPSPSTVPANTDTPSPSTVAQSTGVPSTGVPTTGVPTTGAPTTPATTNVPSSGVPTSAVPRTGTPGTKGTPRSGNPSSGVPTTSTPKSVSAVPGTNAAAAGTGSGKGTGTGAGRNGMPGMGGMGNRGGGKGDEDDEHKIPDYLIQDRETELLGVQPKVLPPGGVIGG
ncbi:hypothetical protein AB0C65_00175 [Nocardia sp. NPDC048505]|uniref:WXG100 family type VII secretion target n=1 Tax=Nocardia sp. NPDC048505 TaxID=3155756 RepID=UPI00340E8314